MAGVTLWLDNNRHLAAGQSPENLEFLLTSYPTYVIFTTAPNVWCGRHIVVAFSRV